MVRHSLNASELWESQDWKKFYQDLFRLQRRVFKAVQVGDKRKARSLQKLMLKSQAARFLAIQQVTQLNTGKKTAGIDGQKSLTFEERFELEEKLAKNHANWKHQGLREIPIPKKDGTIRMLKVPTILERISEFLATRGMNVSEKKTKLTAATDGFDFLGWYFKVQKNGKFRSIPSVDNYKTFRKKVKAIVNNSNYGATVKASKLAPVVRGWRQYHKFCKMEESRNSLYHIESRAFTVGVQQGNKPESLH
jgi:retron-type reverse transcriptase